MPASRLLLTSLPDGSLPSPTRGPVEIVTIGEEVYAQALNQPWQRVGSNPAGVPGSDADYLALLHAASNVVNEGFEAVDGVPAIRYRFDMDGAHYAAYLMAELARRQAPGDLQVIVPRAYRTMSGSGYLWVSQADGVPVREYLDLYFPDADDQFELKVGLEATFSSHGLPLSEPIVAPPIGGDAPSTAGWLEMPLPSGNLQSPISSLQSPIHPWPSGIVHCFLFIVNCSWMAAAPQALAVRSGICIRHLFDGHDACPASDGRCPAGQSAGGSRRRAG